MSTCAAAIFAFQACLIITAICLYDFLCVEIRPQIFIEPDSKKTRSEGRWKGTHTSVAEPLQIPYGKAHF